MSSLNAASELSQPATRSSHPPHPSKRFDPVPLDTLWAKLDGLERKSIAGCTFAATTVSTQPGNVFNLRTPAKVCVCLTVAQVTASVTVDAKKNIVSSDVKFAAAGLVSAFLSVPQIMGAVVGLDDAGHLLFTGNASGFSYLQAKRTVDRTLSNAGFVKTQNARARTVTFAQGSQQLVYQNVEDRDGPDFLLLRGAIFVSEPRARENPVTMTFFPLHLAALIGLGDSYDL